MLLCLYYIVNNHYCQQLFLVSVGGIEPPPHAPKARMIPFHHTEKKWQRRQESNLPLAGFGHCEISQSDAIVWQR
jgi:hypothetical protein